MTGAKSKALGRSDIIGRPLQKLRVDVPELGGHCYVRQMTAGEKDQWDGFLFDRRMGPANGAGGDPDGGGVDGGGVDGGAPSAAPNAIDLTKPGNIRATLVCLTACDAKGDRLFTRDDIPDLDEQFFLPLDRLFDKALELNPILPGSLEQAVKNSDGGQGDASSTD